MLKAVSVLSCLLLSMGGHSQEAKPSDFVVTIISVTNFSEDESLKDSNVIQGITEATKKLEDFFENKVHVNPDMRTTAKQTSDASLRGWLRHDLRYDTRPIHLIFVLTHGFVDKTPESDTNKTDVYMATSDSLRAKIAEKSISGEDFINAFRDMPKRATVFLFLDTCGSGAINGDNLRKTLVHDPEFASRVLVFAASMPKESAYSARFTKALTDIWQNSGAQEHCTRTKIEAFVNQAIKHVSGASSDSPQTVKLIAPMMPEFCLELFNYKSRFLFVSNAAPVPITVTLQAEDAEDPDDAITFSPGENIPIGNLRPVTYTLVAQRDDGASTLEYVDLSTSPGKIKVLFGSDPVADIATTQRAIAYLESREIAPSFVNKLRQENVAALEVEEQRVTQNNLKTDKALADVEVQREWLGRNITKAQEASDAATREQTDAAHEMPNDCFTAFVLMPPACAPGFARLETANARRKEAASQISYYTADLSHTDDLWNLEKGKKNQLAARANEIERLKATEAHFEEVRLAAIGEVASLTAELQKTAFSVKQTERGVAVTLPEHLAYPGIIGLRDEDSLSRLVAVLNQHPATQVEIELSQPGKNYLEKRLTVSERAASLEERLRQLGLISKHVVSRGIINRSAKSPSATVILSHYDGPAD